MLIDIVHNRGGDEILVIWANYETQKGENYSFPIIDGEKYTEEYNAGNDFSGYKYQLVNDMFNKMIHVESTQTGRPIR
ncbi:hypothetical protein KU75_00365 [Pectobacterium odoriferum]|uniref:Uncharacterized protein n=2 Tax=Pectobacteriaceae TaxID=1903410 RepID=A0ABR4VUZ4_9GAMM|nr:hypothetical protein KU75_00365 [Pectobacterium odoriferum]